MCGFIGVYGPDNTHVAPEIYEGLLAIQHRGQDAAGITTFTDHFHVRKGRGLVIEVISPADALTLRGNLGVGHVRYPTVGGGSGEDAQPFHHTYPVGVAMAHNGNVTNFDELLLGLRRRGTRLNSSCDLEAILWVFQDSLAKGLAKGEPVGANQVFEAVRAVHQSVKGAYSVVATIADIGLVAFRDPYGIKPIAFGTRTDEHGTWFACASESVVLDVNGYQSGTSIGAGEALFIDHHRKVHHKKVTEKPHRPCIFELVYFARPDSVLDGMNVYKTRRRFGKALARQWLAEGRPKPDVVIPIPDSSRDAALAMAADLGVPYRDGFVKNRYIGRTFIMPDQQSRSTSVRRKLNPIKLEFEGKDVLLVDDSIVRGNTSQRIVQVAKEAGAKRVFFAVTSPPLVAQCPYGIDMASKREFIADGRSVDEIRSILGVNELCYLDREAMNSAAREGNPEIEEFCNACFNGDYPTKDITVEALQLIEEEPSLHSDRARCN
jgi:amidophosphoribosyltransferase